MKAFRSICYFLTIALLLASCSDTVLPPASSPEEGATPLSNDDDRFVWGEIVAGETFILDGYHTFETPLYLGFNGKSVYFADCGNGGFTCYRYSLSGGEPDVIWRTDSGVNIIDSFATAAGLYIIEFDFTDTGKVRTKLRIIADNGDTSVADVCEGSKIPQVSVFNYWLYIYTEDHRDGRIYTKLLAYDIERAVTETIDSKVCTQNGDGTLRGEMILYGGGCGGDPEASVFYYQVVALEDEPLETGGETTLYYCDVHYVYNGVEPYKLLPLDRKLTYFSGNGNFFLASEYYYDPPFYPSGKLYTFGSPESAEWLCYEIPGVSAPEELHSCFYLSGGIISFSGGGVYFADVENGLIQMFEAGQMTGRPQKHGDSIGCADYAEGKIVFRVFRIPQSPGPVIEHHDFAAEPYIEIDGRGITFEDIPKTGAETVIAQNFVCDITGEIDMKYLLYASAHFQSVENEKKRFEEGLSMQTYIIHKITTLTSQEYNQPYLAGGEYNPLCYAGWRKIIYKYGLVEFEIINVEFTQRHPPEALEKGPQMGDGWFSRSFIAGKTIGDGAYKIFEFGM